MWGSCRYVCCCVAGKGLKRIGVEESPNTTGYYKEAYVMQMTWQQLYEDEYFPFCALRETKPFSPSKFCAIRVEHRPNYKTYRKVNCLS